MVASKSYTGIIIVGVLAAGGLAAYYFLNNKKSSGANSGTDFGGAGGLGDKDTTTPPPSGNTYNITNNYGSDKVGNGAGPNGAYSPPFVGESFYDNAIRNGAVLGSGSQKQISIQQSLAGTVQILPLGTRYPTARDIYGYNDPEMFYQALTDSVFQAPTVNTKAPALSDMVYALPKAANDVKQLAATNAEVKAYSSNPTAPTIANASKSSSGGSSGGGRKQTSNETTYKGTPAAIVVKAPTFAQSVKAAPTPTPTKPTNSNPQNYYSAVTKSIFSK